MFISGELRNKGGGFSKMMEKSPKRVKPHPCSVVNFAVFLPKNLLLGSRQERTVAHLVGPLGLGNVVTGCEEVAVFVVPFLLRLAMEQLWQLYLKWSRLRLPLLC